MSHIKPKNSIAMNGQNDKLPSANFVFFRSLLWIILFAALVASTSNIFSLILIDFVHGNPNRSQNNAISMMMVDSPIFSLIAALGIVIVFSAAQFAQSKAMHFLHPRIGRWAYVCIGLLVPLLSVVTWYCYDYLTPSDVILGIDAGPDWVPYRHGLTLHRYLATLKYQSAVTAFNLLYFEVLTFHRSKKILVSILILVAIIVGMTMGHQKAVEQYHFIDHPQAS
ncbi:hypothetical protein [Burkholderia sp. Ac-20379]|uniref:hypothetical protein n=1 Tax=Burkholderia sp. Ac-20379 TaxID=2703900 RepID=UPI00198263D9|nr:hypothetical protein [Burkholderia sp. Ac-20379]MBN3722588.1 hypothetical protein [Burkholderia sp. Ac-20379]